MNFVAFLFVLSFVFSSSDFNELNIESFKKDNILSNFNRENMFRENSNIVFNSVAFYGFCMLLTSHPEFSFYFLANSFSAMFILDQISVAKYKETFPIFVFSTTMISFSYFISFCIDIERQKYRQTMF